MKEWKKKNRVDEATKVFIVSGGYGDIKRALKKRGWVENKDRDSVCFDLKWTLKTKDIDVNKLEEHQIVNHFAKATSITTKVGLTHSLKNLIWFNNVDIDTFYPRCFDLAIEEELEDFV
jgi:tubulin monoglycylase TTLL3/8